MSGKEVRVSVVIPYKEDRGYLSEAIKSVENQTYPFIDLILSRSDHSLGYNANKGIKKAKGEFIKILAEDDYLPKRSIEELVKAIGEKDMVYGDALLVNEGGCYQYPFCGREVTLEEMVKRNLIHGGTVLYKRSSFDKFGMFDEGLTTAEEYDLHLKWLKKGATHKHIDSFVAFYRQWQGSKSQGLVRNKHRIEYIENIKKRYV